MRTAVAHPMLVANGVPLAAIGACEEVPPCCVTVISACACRHVAPSAGLWQGYSSLWTCGWTPDSHSEDATYMVAIAAVC